MIHIEHMISLHRNLLFVSSPLDDDAVEVSTVDNDCEKKRTRTISRLREIIRKMRTIHILSALLIVSLLIKWFHEQKEID